MRLILLLFMVVVGSFLRCSMPHHQDEFFGDVEFVFKGKYANEPLVMGKNYSYFDQSLINFTKSEFFISQIKLKSASHEHLLTDIAFISLTESHTSIELSEAGYKLKFSNIPVDQYSALSFGIGVPSNLNSKQPSQFDINHPLGEGSHYWSGWKSYIFSKTEGVMTNGADATNFAYHSGFNSAYRSFEFQKNITVKANETTQIVVEMDHQRQFGTSTHFVNIAQDPIFHDGGAFMIAFMNNYQSSIHL